MDVASKVIMTAGSIGAALGATWILSGWLDFSQGKKNEEKRLQDQGFTSIILGAVTVAISASIATYIISLLNKISF